MWYVQIPNYWKKYIYHRDCSFSIQSILENGLIRGGHESDNGRQTVFFTPLNPFQWRFRWRRTSWWFQHSSKMHYHGHWKRNQDVVYWVKLSRAQDQGLQFWQTKSQSLYTVLCQQIASTELLLKTEIEYCSKESRLHDRRQKSRSKPIGNRSSSSR